MASQSVKKREITRLHPFRALLVYIATEILKPIGEVVPFGVFVGKSDNVPTRNVTELSQPAHFDQYRLVRVPSQCRPASKRTFGLG